MSASSPTGQSGRRAVDDVAVTVRDVVPWKVRPQSVIDLTNAECRGVSSPGVTCRLKQGVTTWCRGPDPQQGHCQGEFRGPDPQ